MMETSATGSSENNFGCDGLAPMFTATGSQPGNVIHFNIFSALFIIYLFDNFDKDIVTEQFESLVGYI